MAPERPVPPPSRPAPPDVPFILTMPLPLFIAVCAVDGVVILISGLIKAGFGHHLAQCDSLLGQLSTSVDPSSAHGCGFAHAGYDVSSWIFYLTWMMLIGIVGARVLATAIAHGWIHLGSRGPKP